MKRNYFITGGGILAFFLLSISISAQSSKNLDSKINQVLADTTFLKATVVTLEPGQKTDLHTHPAYFAYALTAGKMKVHYKDGPEVNVELKPGDAMVTGPEKPHITENTGTTTVKFLMVELKEHPYTGQK